MKRRAAAVGLDPARYAGRSLRAGLATSAAAGGASERAIVAQTGHRSADMVRRYVREANLFAADNGASLGGLRRRARAPVSLSSMPTEAGTGLVELHGPGRKPFHAIIWVNAHDARS